jgi:hypothetical protein
MIFKVVRDSFGDTNFPKVVLLWLQQIWSILTQAIECLRTLRQGCIREQEGNRFNSAMKDFQVRVFCVSFVSYHSSDRVNFVVVILTFCRWCEYFVSLWFHGHNCFYVCYYDYHNFLHVITTKMQKTSIFPINQTEDKASAFSPQESSQVSWTHFFFLSCNVLVLWRKGESSSCSSTCGSKSLHSRGVCFIWWAIF